MVNVKYAVVWWPPVGEAAVAVRHWRPKGVVSLWLW